MLSETTYELLAAHPFLRGLSARQVDKLSIWGHTTHFHSGTRILAEGGRADRFWLIDDGEVTLTAAVPGRGDVELEVLGPGDVLGWSWLFPPYRWQYTATARGAVHAVVLDGPGVRELCENDQPLGYLLMHRFLNVVIDRLQRTRLELATA